MARVLLASELGSKLGHIGQLLPLARALRGRGHEVVFAVREVAAANALLGPERFACIQAPVWHAPREPGPAPQPCSYSEILQHYGFRDPEVLVGLLRAWRAIYASLQPRIVVCEFAPAALLACRGLDIFSVQYGMGFTVPPRVEPLPSFRTWEAVSRERLERSDAVVLDTANAALSQLQAPALNGILDLLEANAEFVCTFAELDHYRDRPATRHRGPMYTVDHGLPSTWPDADGPRVFVYLRPNSRAFEPVAQALSTLDCPVVWAAPGISPDARKRYESARLVFQPGPVRIDQVTGAAQAAILHGGHGTSAAMLLAGIPLLLLPEHAEQGVVARNIVASGAGVTATHAPADIATKLTAVLNASGHGTAARRFHRRYAGFDPADSATAIADELPRTSGC